MVESGSAMETPDPQKTISTLNTLIEALKDGEKGYQQVADATHDADLKTLFSGYAEQRHEFAKALQKAAFELGEAKPETGGSVTSAVHRGWIGLKNVLTSQDRHSILAECERGEDSAVKSYRLALADASLGAAAKALVQTQHDAVLAAHNDIKKLRDDSTRAK